MKKFDVIVIGAGSGLNISSSAADMGLKVALIDKGPMGGTCLNRGCIPSKIVIHSADVAETIKNSSKFFVNSKLNSVDFGKITKNASKIVDGDAKDIENAIRKDKNTTLYKTEARFVGDRTIEVGGETIKGNKVVIAAGTRPSIPPVKGLDKVDYMTSTEALRLDKQPKVLTIIGGGYIAAELAHFYGALGTKINILQRNKYLVPAEDLEVKKKFTEIFSKKYNVYTNFNVDSVVKKGSKYIVHASSKDSRKEKKVESDKLLVATGRRPNTDILEVEKGGIKVNKAGYLVCNKFLETSAKNVWALGDIVGNYLFKHSANLEAGYVYNNALRGKRLKVDYTAMPWAIFSSPQISGVGFTEEQLKEKGVDYAVGKYDYMDSGMGTALQDVDGFCKVLVDKKNKKILGCHIMGTDASSIIHEILVAMKNGLDIYAIKRTVHIHPALSEVVQRAVNAVEI